MAVGHYQGHSATLSVLTRLAWVVALAEQRRRTLGSFSGNVAVEDALSERRKQLKWCAASSQLADLRQL
jgi:hypothetical protein